MVSGMQVGQPGFQRLRGSEKGQEHREVALPPWEASKVFLSEGLRASAPGAALRSYKKGFSFFSVIILAPHSPLGDSIKVQI